MRSPKLQTTVFVVLALLLFSPQFSLAQYVISTVAGGGPTNLAELSASIGSPGSIAFDAAGNTYIADPYSSHIFEVNATTGILTVVAGNGTHGYSGDGGPATSAALNNPVGVFVDGSGNIFIADTNNCLIRKVSGGDISTVAGNPSLLDPCGYAGDGGPATSAQLDAPYGVFVDGAGDIFIADASNAAIREVVAGTIQTVAGNETICPDSTKPCGDGGPATSAELDLPEGVFVDGTGNIFIADTDSSRIRVVNTSTAPITIAGVTIPAGYIQTVAGAYYNWEETGCQFSGNTGPATSAYLCSPAGVFVDSAENIYIADTNNLAIREIAVSTTNLITTVAGTLGVAGYSPNGTVATSADLNYPNNMVVDSSGDIFIADALNFVIREVSAPPNNEIQTTIGNNTQGYSGDGGTAVDAELNHPGGVAIDAAGNFYIADTANSVVRKVVAATGDIQTVAGNGTVCALASPPVPPLCGDGGPATGAVLNGPEGVFVDASGNIFISDTGDNLIRVVNTGSQSITIANVVVAAGAIETVAGNGTGGYVGDTGQATSAELSGPYGVFVDRAENIFIADTSNSVIREVTGSSGVINTVAGNGTQCTVSPCGDGGAATSAQLGFPGGVFVDSSENIYIADTFDDRIREVTASNSVINTVAGNGTRGYAGDGAVATSANLDTPSGVFVDLSGDIFIADTDNAAIREVAAATGFIQTVAGIAPGVAGGLPTPGFSGDGGPATSAELNTPSSVFGSAAGNLFIADTDNQRIRALVPGIFVTVTPNPVNVVVGTQQQFTATVTGTTNTAVTWQANGVAGGNSTVGTISAAGLYQAPATVPTPATVTITAISAADGTTSGSAQATIVTVNTNITVTVSPSGTTQVYTTTTQQFTATVTGTSDQSVNWYVEGSAGGDATFGTIDTTGGYTAPAAVPTPATITITAYSQAASNALGTATVTIISNPPSAADPTPQTISPGGQANYTIVLNENTGIPGQPITLSCSQSTLPVGATCAFFSQAGSPITAVTPGPQAVQFSLTISVPTGSAVASVEYPKTELPQRMRLAIYSAFLPLAGIFFLGAGLRDKRRRWLALSGFFVFLILLTACGGSSKSTPTNPEVGTYNVKVQGKSAQSSLVTITVAGLTVQ
jgi:trimeric autotransporter adhesin